METTQQKTDKNPIIMETAKRGTCRNLAARVPIAIYNEIYEIAVKKNMTVTDVIIILLKGALKYMKEN